VPALLVTLSHRREGSPSFWKAREGRSGLRAVCAGSCCRFGKECGEAQTCMYGRIVYLCKVCVVLSKGSVWVTQRQKDNVTGSGMVPWEGLQRAERMWEDMPAYDSYSTLL
jgi:hypothetical protein